MMLRPWHRHASNFGANLLPRLQLLCFVWVQCSVMVSDKFQVVKKYKQHVEIVIWQIWDLNSAKPVPDYIDQISGRQWRLPLQGKQDKISGEFDVCVCVCPHHLCPQRDSPISVGGPSHSINCLYCRRTVDRKRNGLKQTNDAAVLSRGGQIQLLFSPPFTFYCKDDKQSDRHLNQQADKHLQACRTPNTPKEFLHLRGFVLLLMRPTFESLVGVCSHCLLMSLPQTIPSHQTASDGWLN